MTLKLALLGCAHIHMADVVAAVSDNERARLSAVWDHEDDRAAFWAGRLEAPTVATPAEAAEAADAVIVMSETSRHPELVATAADAGKDLFVEKPLARSAAEAATVRAAIEGADVRFHTGYLLRELGAHGRIRALLADGALGAPVRARAWFAHPGALAGWFEQYPWTTDPEAAGFGGFGDEGVHAIDLLAWTLDRPFVAGTAVIDRVTENARIDERGEALLRFDDGTPATVAAGWTEPRLTAELSITGTTGQARMVNGELVVDTPWGSERVAADAPAARRPVDHFLDVLTGASANPLVPVREAETHCRILDGLYRAAAEPTWVRLDRSAD